MATEIQRWQPPTTLSLEQRAKDSRMTLQCATSPLDAAKAAKQLIGQWQHVKAADPEVFAASVAAVLAGYPLGVVQECCDPRRGLAREEKFLSLAALVEWCDERLSFHQSVAGYQGRIKAAELARQQREVPPTPERRRAIAELFKGLADFLRKSTRKSPLDVLHAVRRDQLEMTRKSILTRQPSETAE